ncbi:hypothetical protein SDD30_15820 [Moorella naiadis]|uniref:hypothetical protein n=1 Tax=Moorella naiadis (nom. illeg.) TaxID=3093670 RepID=UPI003D9CA886
MLKIKGFKWDARNIGHIAKHGVRPEEAEEVFLMSHFSGGAAAELTRRLALRTTGGC